MKLNLNDTFNSQVNTIQPLTYNRRRLQRYAPALLEICKYLISSENDWRVIIPQEKKQEIFQLLTRILGAKGVDPTALQMRSIGIIWSIEDVQSVRPDLSDEQAAQVLEQAQRKHDCNIGITWEVLEYFADEIFGEIPDDFVTNDED